MTSLYVTQNNNNIFSLPNLEKLFPSASFIIDNDCNHTKIVWLNLKWDKHLKAISKSPRRDFKWLKAVFLV